MLVAGRPPQALAAAALRRSGRWAVIHGRSLLCAAALLVAWPAAARDAPVVAAAAYLVEVDGRVLWSRHADTPLPPASLTKLMTALLVLEGGKPLGDIVTVSPHAAGAQGARLGLKRGEQLQLRDLLTAALLQSANDACLALAEHLGGSEATFVSAMNRRAAQLGLTHTHFVNACGHDAPGHRSSARDLATLAKVAMHQPALAGIVGLVRSRIQTQAGRTWQLVNTNELVGRYEGATGIKTGYTARAGKCLIALAQRGDVSVLLVALNAPNRWWDSVALLDRAFAASTAPTTPSR